MIPGSHIQHEIGTLLTLYSSVCRPRELQKPYTREPLVCTCLSLLVTVNPLSYMAVVTMSCGGDVIAKHFSCQSLSQLVPLQINSVFLFLGHSCSVVGSVLMVVS